MFLSKRDQENDNEIRRHRHFKRHCNHGGTESAIKALNEADGVLLLSKKDLTAKALNEYNSTLKHTTAKKVDKARVSLKLRHANN